MDDEGLVSDVGSGAAAGSAFGPVGSVVGAGVGLLGGILGNETNSANAAAANAQQSEEFYANLDWQQELATRGVTMKVNDMENAGINPILAASSGVSGASAGGGSAPAAIMPQYRNVGEAAANSAGMFSQMEQQRANIRVADTQAAVNSAQVGKIQAETANTLADNPRVSAYAGFATDAARQSVFAAQNQVELIDAQTQETRQRASESESRQKLLIPAEANSLNSASRLNTLRVPGAVNQANYESSPMGAVMPYIHGVTGAVNSAGQAAGSLAPFVK